jgi:uncharacterized protein YkwD
VNHKLTLALGGVAFLLGAMAWTAAAPPAANASGSCSVDDASLDGEEQAFVPLINAYRTRNGAPALVSDPALSRSAAWLANDLAGHSTFSHTDSLGRSPWVRMPDCGVGSPGGENLVAGTNTSSAQMALDAWIGSPDHREVMLTKEFTSIGIARVYKPGSTYGWYWVTDFGYGGGGTQSVATTAPPPPPPPTSAPRAAAPRSEAPAPPPPPPPAPKIVGLRAGLSLFSWEGGYVSPEDVFGASDNVAMVYVFDQGSQQWLRWGLALDPKLRTLNELRTGVSYWVIATGPVDVTVQ